MPINRETREYRKTHNLCPRDGKPNTPNRKMCEGCLKKFAEKTKRHRQKRTADSLCLSCGIRVDNVKFCDKCKKSVALSSRNSHIKRYRSRKQSDQCVECGDTAETDKTMCLVCLQRRSDNQQIKRNTFIADDLCSQCGNRPPEGNGKRCQVCIDKRNDWYQDSTTQVKDKVRRDGNRKAVLEHYGQECVCCREIELCFLAIDHIDGKGSTHRKEINKHGSGFFKWLVDNDFPEGFRVLCHNCNMGAYLNGGICPHKTRTEFGQCESQAIKSRARLKYLKRSQDDQAQAQDEQRCTKF